MLNKKTDTSFLLKKKLEYKPSQNIKPSDVSIESINFLKPEISFFVDASVKEKTYIAGYGIRKEEILSEFKYCVETKNNHLAELLAIDCAVNQAIKLNQENLEIFTDSMTSLEVIRKFQSIQSVSMLFFACAENICFNLKNFKSYKINWIPRHKNILADFMCQDI